MAKPGDKHDEAIVKRVSRKHGDEGHGGAWKVAFADFCMALMCLFLVLWVLAARNSEQVDEVKQMAQGSIVAEGGGKRIDSEGHAKGSLIDRNPVPAQGDTPASRRAFANGSGPEPGTERELKGQLESAADLSALSERVQRLSEEAGLAGNLKTDVSAQGLRVMLHDTDKEGMFARGSAMPSERFRDLLRKLGPLFAQIENRMLVIGHTDSLQYVDRGRSAYSNWTLSSQRAMAARLNLVGGGMPADSVLQVIGMADRAPLDRRDPRAAANRRIELLILTKAQAANLATMFGMPEQTAPLIDGVDSNLPSSDALHLLRPKDSKTRVEQRPSARL